MKVNKIKQTIGSNSCHLTYIRTMRSDEQITSFCQGALRVVYNLQFGNEDLQFAWFRRSVEVIPQKLVYQTLCTLIPKNDNNRNVALQRCGRNFRGLYSQTNNLKLIRNKTGSEFPTFCGRCDGWSQNFTYRNRKLVKSIGTVGIV